MKITRRSRITSVALMLCLVGCGDQESNSGLSNAETATDQWLGQWNGPEGTFLRLAGGNGNYTIVIQNLDGPQNFQGSAVGDQIQFERHGVKESIRATDGAETGMKWLADKSHCLTIRPGEGYCRD